MQTPGAPPDPQDRRLEQAERFLAGSFGALGAVVLLTFLSRPPTFLDLIVIALVVVSAAAALLYWRAAGDLEQRRRSEVEGFARILQGLSRSVSPDAIVEAIAEELGVAAGADHVVVVRLRPNSGLLEATLVTNRAGVPSSTTVLPLSDLEDPLDPVRIAATVPVAVGPGPFAGDPVAAPELAHAAARPGLQGPGWDGFREVARAGAPAPAAPGDALLGASLRAGFAPRPVSNRPRFSEEAADRVAERLATKVRAVYGLKHTIVAPLSPANVVVGAIVLSRRTGDDWPTASGRLLAGAATEASAALARAYSHRAAEERAATDALTGLPNRRYFDEYISLSARRRRSDDAFGILMIDIDHFKRVNDRFGHATGDAVLKAVAGAIVSAVREDDVPARFGGEEFVVLLRNPGFEIAAEVGERVRLAVRRLDLSDLGVDGVSVSVGVSVANGPDRPINELIERADQALYRAKRGGRDRVMAG